MLYVIVVPNKVNENLKPTTNPNSFWYNVRKVVLLWVMFSAAARVGALLLIFGQTLYTNVTQYYAPNHCSKLMKPPQSLPLQMAERLLRAQPDSVANHFTARSISDWRALT